MLIFWRNALTDTRRQCAIPAVWASWSLAKLTRDVKRHRELTWLKFQLTCVGFPLCICSPTSIRPHPITLYPSHVISMHKLCSRGQPLHSFEGSHPLSCPKVCQLQQLSLFSYVIFSSLLYHSQIYIRLIILSVSHIYPLFMEQECFPGVEDNYHKFFALPATYSPVLWTQQEGRYA